MTEPMKTADEFLNSKTYIQRWDDYIPRSARYITKVMDEYADLKVLAERERIKKDKNHLQWLYARLVSKHGENEHYDYMIKFKELIDSL